MWCSTEINIRTNFVFLIIILSWNYQMFRDDSHLFYSDNNINTPFITVNSERQKINEWFVSNKLNVKKKQSIYFFYKTSKKDEIPLVLPKLVINNYQITRAELIKYWGVFLDENLAWKEHIKHFEKKIAKNIGLLFKAKIFLNKKSLLSYYISCIYSYINYTNEYFLYAQKWYKHSTQLTNMMQLDFPT